MVLNKLVGVVILSFAMSGIAYAQTQVTRTGRLSATERIVVGSGVFGATSPIQVVGIPDKGTETLCIYVDASGNFKKGACAAGDITGISFVLPSALFITPPTGSPCTVGECAFTFTLANQVANSVFQRAGTTGTPSFSTSLVLGGTLGVTGITTLTGLLNANGGIAVDGTNFTVDGTTGAVSTASTLTVVGTSDLRGDVSSTTGSLTLADSVIVTGSLDARADVFDSGGNLTLNDAVDISGVTTFSSTAQSNGWASQVSGWGVTAAGSADFRYIFVDELHAKVFIADLEQALAGGQIITKSVALVTCNTGVCANKAQAFQCPAANASATLYVKDLPSAADMQVFQANDLVVLRTFSRSAGSLTIGDCVGSVSAPNTTPAGYQSWTFTRCGVGNALCNNAGYSGMMTAATWISDDSIVLDYGVSGNGYAEVTAVDGLYGVNSPYYQVVSWVGAPVAAQRTVNARFGKLTGITSVANDYGLLAGIYGSTSTCTPNCDAPRYIKASNNGVELHGIDLTLYDDDSANVLLNRGSGGNNPYIAIGNPAPTTFASGTGIWMGSDAGTYKFRVGTTAGNRMTWDGTNLNVVGTITITTGSTGYAALTDKPTLGSVAALNTVALGTNTSGNYAGSTGVAGAANTIVGQGALATKGSVDLNTTEVTNKSLANLDSAANTKLGGIAAGATVGAAWATNLTGRPVELTDGRITTSLNSLGTVLTKVAPTGAIGTPASAGLYLGSDKMGFYQTASVAGWKTYMDNTGKFYLSGTGAHALAWDGTNLSITGSITVSGGNAATTTYVDQAEADATAVANTKETPAGAQTKANTAESNATAVANTKETPTGAQTKANTAESNATAVANTKETPTGAQGKADTAYTNAVNWASTNRASTALDNVLDSTVRTKTAWGNVNDATKIDGQDIYTGSIYADAIAANAITATKIAADALDARTITGSTIQSTASCGSTATPCTRLTSSGLSTFGAWGAAGIDLNHTNGLTFAAASGDSDYARIIGFSGPTARYGSWGSTHRIFVEGTITIGEQASNQYSSYASKILLISDNGTTTAPGNANTMLSVDATNGTAAVMVTATGGASNANLGASGFYIPSWTQWAGATQTVCTSAGSGAAGYIFTYGGACSAQSSERIKKYIQPEMLSLAILDVVPVSFLYNWESDSDPRRLGASAERVADLGLEFLVIRDDQNLPGGIHYDRMALYLIPLVKEQRERITALEQRLAALEARVH